LFGGIIEDMLIVVTRHIIVIINIILITIVSLVKLKNLKYTNEFVLHVNEGEQVARSLAEKYQLKFERQALPNENYFVFRQIITNRRRKRSLNGSDNDLVNELKNDPLIDWVEQQQVKKRVKRNLMFYHPIKSSLSSTFNDPDWDKQWYMHDENEHGRAMNISGAWRLGFTGKNVVVTILDDGIEKDHPDLIQNYVSIYRM
jgi:subtilisin family serine protease